MLSMHPSNTDCYYNIIHRNAERLHKLVLDILDASRIENNHLELKKERFDLVELIDNIVEDANNKIKGESDKKNLKVIYDMANLNNLRNDNNNYHFSSVVDTKEKEITEIKEIGQIERGKQEQSHSDKIKIKKIITMDADRTRIGQVISNLINNAIKFSKTGTIRVTTFIQDIKDIANDSSINYTDDHGHIVDYGNDDSNERHFQIEIDDMTTKNSKSKCNNKEIIISVQDEGKGIDPNILPHLFSKFISEPSSGGTGLGLFISKNIVEAHGGKIWMEQNSEMTMNKGVTFLFSLPLDDC